MKRGYRKPYTPLKNKQGIRRSFKFTPPEITEQEIEEVLNDCKSHLRKKTRIRQALLSRQDELIDKDRCGVYDEIKLRYVSLPRIDLVWLPDGRKIAIAYDEHNFKRKICDGSENFGEQIIQYFLDRIEVNFDIMLEVYPRYELIYDHGYMVEFGSNYRDCFVETTSEGEVRYLPSGCPPNVNYHSTDNRGVGKTINETRRILHKELRKKINEKRGEKTIEDYIETIRDFIRRFPELQSISNEFNVLEQSLLGISEEDRKILYETLATYLVNMKSDPIASSVVFMDLYTISRYETEKPRNSVFWFGSYHTHNYSTYFKNRYPDSSILSFFPNKESKFFEDVIEKDLYLNSVKDGSCIDLGQYNLDDFFMDRTS